MRGAPRGVHVFGAALIAVGIFALYKAASLPFGTLRQPDAGFFPVLVALALSVFGAYSIRSRKSGAEEAQPSTGVSRIFILAVLLAVYAWLLSSAGFILCTTLLLVVCLRALGNARWPATVMGSLGAAVGCYVVFTRLGLPLPPGLLGF